MDDQAVLAAVSQSGFSDAANRRLYDAIVGVTSKLFPNRQGQVFTLALTTGGLVKNPAEFNYYYQKNRDCIDGYFNRVDMDALGDAIGGTVGDGIKNQTPVLVTGIAIGAGAMMALKILRVF